MKRPEYTLFMLQCYSGCYTTETCYIDVHCEGDFWFFFQTIVEFLDKKKLFLGLCCVDIYPQRSVIAQDESISRHHVH